MTTFQQHETMTHTLMTLSMILAWNNIKYYITECATILTGHTFTCTGQAAPSPRAQIVCPSICLLSSQIMSISVARASPFTKRHIILFIQSTPTETEQRVRRRALSKNKSLLKKTTAVVEVTLSAGRALAAALVFVELNQAGDGSNNISL